MGQTPLIVARLVLPTPSGPYFYSITSTIRRSPAVRPRALSPEVVALARGYRARIPCFQDSPSRNQTSELSSACLEPRPPGPLWRHDQHNPTYPPKARATIARRWAGKSGLISKVPAYTHPWPLDQHAPTSRRDRTPNRRVHIPSTSWLTHQIY